MPIIKQKEWNQTVACNKDSYDKVIADISLKAMEILDTIMDRDYDCYDIIKQAYKETGHKGITGFMVGLIAESISYFYSDGDTFRRKWNLKLQYIDEGEKANKEGTILNPATIMVEKNE